MITIEKTFGDFYQSECPVCKEGPVVCSIVKGTLTCYECGSFFYMKDGKIEWNAEVCLLGIKELGYLIVYHRDNWEEL